VTGLGIAVFTIITYRNNLGFLHGVSPFDSRAWRGGLPGRFNSDQVAFSLALVPGFAFLACEGLRPHLKALATAATLPIVGLAFLIVASREGFVAGALGVLAAAVLARGHRRRMALALGVAFAGLLLLLALETGTVPSYVSQRLAQAQYDQLGGRLPLWRLGLDLFEQNPVAGLGAYGYQTVSPRYHVSVDGAPFIDNAYLRVLTDTGIVGLVLLLTLLALILYAAVFGGGRDPAVIVLATMILVFLNGADNLDMLWVWISLGVLYCFALTAKTAPISEPSGAFGRRQRHASLILSAASGAGDGGG
jgi:O-antigen ligase